jgi:DNA-binding MarR family transcriptional regulator
MKTNTDNQTIRKFRDILRRFEREVFVQSSESCCSGVTLAQCHTLLEIENKNKETITELSKTLGLDKSTVSRTVDGLVNIGLVDRSIPAENRRMAELQLTDAGKNVCKTINCRNDDYFEDILSVLSDAEKEELSRLFEIITARMIQLRGCCKIKEEK